MSTLQVLMLIGFLLVTSVFCLSTLAYVFSSQEDLNVSGALEEHKKEL